MALRFTDPHAMSLVAPHLYPGEQVLFRARGVEKPWYSRLLSRLGGLFWRYWLVVATNQRLVFVQHGGVLSGYAARRSESFAWGDIDQVALGWGVLNKTLRVRGGRGQLSRDVIIPRTWLRGNFDAARGAVEAWRSNRASLPGAAPPGLLPMTSAYGGASY